MSIFDDVIKSVEGQVEQTVQSQVDQQLTSKLGPAGGAATNVVDGILGNIFHHGQPAAPAQPAETEASSETSDPQ